MRTVPGVYLAAARSPGTANALLGITHGAPVAMQSANASVGLATPRHPGRVPTGPIGWRPGVSNPPTTLGSYVDTIGPTAIPGGSADALYASVKVRGAAGSRMPFPAGFLPGGVEGRRIAIAATPAGDVMLSSQDVTGPGGLLIRPSDGPAPIPPQQSAPSDIWAGPRTALPPPGPSWAPALPGTPQAPGAATFSVPEVFDSGSAYAPGPAAPAATYQPNAYDKTEVGAYRFGDPIPGAPPRNKKEMPQRGKWGWVFLASIAAFWVLAPRRH